MIEFTKSYKTADGQVFGSVEDAQKHEISKLIEKLRETSSDGKALHESTPFAIAAHIITNKDILIDILTTTPNSKPKARTTHGGTKNRKKTLVTDASASTTSTTNVPTSA